MSQSLFKNFKSNEQKVFQDFINTYNLNEQQSVQFYTYILLLLEARQNFNLTAIDTVIDTIDVHCKDSLALTKCMDLAPIKSLADVGSGGGLPGIPIKILFPHIAMTLIEVNVKKVAFLHEVIEKLQLDNIKVVQCDWRNFLRQSEDSIELFVARASLHTDELIRLFRPSCLYNKALLVYWASKHWQLSALEKPYFLNECNYIIEGKERKLIFFKNP